jgi:hypothetical protein
MRRIFAVVIMAEESVIEAELQNDGDERQGDRQQRQHAELGGAQIARIERHEHQPEGAVDEAADAEDQRMLDGLFDLAVNRGGLLPLNYFLTQRTQRVTQRNAEGLLCVIPCALCVNQKRPLISARFDGVA